MELASLIAELSDPLAYSDSACPGSIGKVPIEKVELRQTHISIVCLTENLVYKIRKPVRFSFLDFSSLEKRHIDCEREVELNRRLAPDVYLGVVPIIKRDGRLYVDAIANVPFAREESDHGNRPDKGHDEIIEWAVKMRRLPEAATLKHRLAQGEIEPGTMKIVGRRLAAFHAAAATGPEVAAFGRYAAVSHNLLENLDSGRACGNDIVDQALIRRLDELTRARLDEVRELIERRARRGVPCDTHGDLRLDHVYFFPERDPPADLCIIDCIEFNDGFRYADPVSDIAFLVMDLKFQGRSDLASELSDAYFATTGDTEGLELLPLYVSYRSAVRAKVATLEFTESEIPESNRLAALERARGHWLLALGELEVPSCRPCLVLIGGLQGTGKSTLARGLAEVGGFTVIRTDVVRKELAGIVEANETGAASTPNQRQIPLAEVAVEPDGLGNPTAVARQVEIYSENWTTRTYDECLRRALEFLRQGRRVIVDGTFSLERHRLQFLDAARRMSVPCLILTCQAEPDVIHHRLDERTGDISDADWNVYLAAVKKWEPSGELTSQVTTAIDSGDSAQSARDSAVKVLRSAGLLEAESGETRRN